MSTKKQRQLETSLDSGFSKILEILFFKEILNFHHCILLSWPKSKNIISTDKILNNRDRKGNVEYTLRIFTHQ